MSNLRRKFFVLIAIMLPLTACGDSQFSDPVYDEIIPVIMKNREEAKGYWERDMFNKLVLNKRFKKEKDALIAPYKDKLPPEDFKSLNQAIILMYVYEYRPEGLIEGINKYPIKSYTIGDLLKLRTKNDEIVQQYRNRNNPQ